jgi:hypothetical protein
MLLLIFTCVQIHVVVFRVVQLQTQLRIVVTRCPQEFISLIMAVFVSHLSPGMPAILHVSKRIEVSFVLLVIKTRNLVVLSFI